MTFFFRLFVVLPLVWVAVTPISSDAAAQEVKAPIIAVIDWSRAISQSKAGQSVLAQFNKQREVYQAEINSAEAKLKKAREELAQQQAVLAPEAFARKRKAFQQQAEELQRTAQTRKRSLDQLRAQGFSQVEEVLRQILQEMMKERGYDMVMNVGPGGGAIILASRELFITEEVVKMLDEKLPKVTIKPAE